MGLECSDKERCSNIIGSDQKGRMEDKQKIDDDMQQLYMMKTTAELQPLIRPHSSHVSTTRKKLENYSYGLQDQIGKGYSSQVFKGSNDLMGHTVAIKVIDLHKLTDRVLQDMLMSEISSLRALKGSPNILQLEEVYSTRNNIYIITEMCESGDLVKLIEGRPRTQEQSAEIMEQLVHGYLEICKNKIVHRDIKPANIFLEGKTCKIADFGFSILADHIKDPCSYNVGSPLYMAPEVLLKNHYSYKSDIWSLGIIYYEILFGSRPWSARDQKQLAQKIRVSPISKLIPKPISRMSMSFLIGTLNPDVTKRMSPEQLAKYCSWSQTGYDKPDKQKIYLQPSVSHYSISSTTTSFKQNSRGSTGTNLIYNPLCKKVKAIIPTMPSTEKNANQSIVYTRKEIVIVRRDNTKILLSQLHFCRFLYKLTVKLQQCCVNYEKVKENMKGLIYYKLAMIQSCQKTNILNLDGYEQYRFSTDFQRIMSLCKQYVNKYMDSLGSLGKHWILNTNFMLQQLKLFIKDLLRYIKNTFKNLYSAEYKLYLSLMDRSITAFDLIKLSQKNTLEEFSRNSNIESIVQYEEKDCDLQAIEDKMKKLGLD